jgi:hypothetical protein
VIGSRLRGWKNVVAKSEKNGVVAAVGATGVEEARRERAYGEG